MVPMEIIHHIFTFRIPDPVFLVFQSFMNKHFVHRGLSYLDEYGRGITFPQWYFMIKKHERIFLYIRSLYNSTE